MANASLPKDTFAGAETIAQCKLGDNLEEEGSTIQMLRYQLHEAKEEIKRLQGSDGDASSITAAKGGAKVTNKNLAAGLERLAINEHRAKIAAKLRASSALKMLDEMASRAAAAEEALARAQSELVGFKRNGNSDSQVELGDYHERPSGLIDTSEDAFWAEMRALQEGSECDKAADAGIFSSHDLPSADVAYDSSHDSLASEIGQGKEHMAARVVEPTKVLAANSCEARYGAIINKTRDLTDEPTADIDGSSETIDAACAPILPATVPECSEGNISNDFVHHFPKSCGSREGAFSWRLPSAQLSTEEGGGVGTKTVSASVLAACRAALVDSPAACRAALAKHEKSIDSTLKRTLEIVGGYEVEEYQHPLHESARRGDLAISQTLLAAGGYVRRAHDDDIAPLDLVTDEACRDLFEHHFFVLDAIRADQAVMVSAARAHCDALSASSNEAVPSTAPLREYHLDPAFNWAPHGAHNTVIAWARDVFTVHVVHNHQLFADLPDDCCGDVSEFLVMTMARSEILHVSRHYSSKALAWVHEVLAAAVVAKATAELGPAIREDDCATVKRCLERGANVELLSGYSYPPLVHAAYKGQNAVVKLLLEAGADIECLDEISHIGPALLNASRKGHPAVVESLLVAGANKDATDKRGGTALIYATDIGHTAVVKLLLQAGADVNLKNEGNNTALLLASNLGYAAIVKLLVEAGADINAKNGSGETALIIASFEEHASVVNLLLQAGADKTIRCDGDNTALIWASRHCNVAIVSLLLQRNRQGYNQQDENTSLIEASARGHITIVLKLLEAGANIDARDHSGCTALMLASANGYIITVKALLQRGADIDAMNDNGDIALGIASRKNNKAIIKLLHKAASSW